MGNHEGTGKQQRNTPFYVIDGEKMRADEISKEYNISIDALKHRLRKGMDPKLAATTPVETKFHKKRIPLGA